MTALYTRLLRLHARLLVAIAAGVCLFEVFLIWVAAQLDTGPGLRTFLANLLPPEVQAVVFEQLGLASFSGAVAFGYRHPFLLVAVVAFMVAAATTPAAERETGFLDLVLARPVPRRSYLASVALLTATGAVVLAAAALAGAAIGLALVDGPDELPWTSYAAATLGLALLLLAVGGIALLAATGAQRRGSAVARALGLILAFYWLDFMGGFWDTLDLARWLSPFSYYDPTGVALGDGLPLRDVVVLLAAALVTTAAAFVEFQRQDL